MFSIDTLFSFLLTRYPLTEQFHQDLIDTQKQGRSVTQYLLQALKLKEEDLKQLYSQSLHLEMFYFRDFLADEKLARWIDADMAAKWICLPLALQGNVLKIAVDDPFNLQIFQTIQFSYNLQVSAILIARQDWQRIYQQLYQQAAPALLFERNAESQASTAAFSTADSEQDELTAIFLAAVNERATDIHFEPLEKGLRIRFRVDGELHIHRLYAEQYKYIFLSRLKLWAGLNIAERRLPQDGQFSRFIHMEEIDMRLSTLPLIHGEKAVVRLLRREFLSSNFQQLGMSAQVTVTFQKLIRAAHGIILVCGPTACGKTTTLYTTLQQLDREKNNIVSIEDPVEYRLAGINQVQVNPKIEFGFARGLRSVLRQDPNIILVGEIRDTETAEAALQAALTGHLVFSTLHTNDAPGAITRLLEMGLEPYLIASTVIGILSQRLVRLACPYCSVFTAAESSAYAHLLPAGRELPPRLIQEATGCSKCSGTGYIGRTGVFELLAYTDELRALTLRKADITTLRAASRRAGMLPIYLDALEKCFHGETTLTEVYKLLPQTNQSKSK
ncbi:MAG: GspE/PulE family protein [Negativicutes bacterium]|nr:GspE/PulE family protein [Negativicutes bacterium]